jgi:hypothetical protein
MSGAVIESEKPAEMAGKWLKTTAYLESPLRLADDL